ncbi:hypothetical protein B6N60_00910 [Richelia sinica FACHB-800]|uniref:Uncharacterized protein n=1 Tax=Richelia sinica FACHB-800 TaxID=1357546 RepID=A0A975Y3K4_9NOST|nr:hypothetical protein [Richelia sinica]MBD2664375.1 hypothetical protein [Richelia sinica FACHB-800]QXE22228.1 hypothetical protein B6N60_00910 [Richelia sinica FACHB-800]
MAELRIIVEEHPQPDAIKTVINHLIEYNNSNQAPSIGNLISYMDFSV